MSALSQFVQERLQIVTGGQPEAVLPLARDEVSGHVDACYDVHWARDEDDVQDAQRLRYQVFAHEMGVRLNGSHPAMSAIPSGAGDARDVDPFDAHCKHVLVRLPRQAGQSRGQVIGTYRLLAPEAVSRAGDLYCATEFDLRPLAALRPRMAELGRACVHSDYRSGGVVLALWGAVVRYTVEHEIETLLGSVSVPVRGLCGGHRTANGHEARASISSLWAWLKGAHLAAPEWQIRPLRAFLVATGSKASEAIPDDEVNLGNRVSFPAPAPAPSRAEIPALIKGYLACNARVLGPPAFDEDFGTADFPMLLRMQDLPLRHRRRFTGYATESV
jgi:putative hemolysin